MRQHMSVLNNAASRLIQSFYVKVRGLPAPRRRRRTTRHSYQNKREVSRRAAQIARGQLTVSNGLVLS